MRALWVVVAMCAVGEAEAFATECGQPPSSTIVSDELREAIRTLACSSSELSAGLNLVVAEIPFGASFSDSQKKCSSASKDVAAARKTIETYLATEDSILVAECGYRICLLGEKASPEALNVMNSVCTPASQTSGGGLHLTSAHVRAAKTCDDSFSSTTISIQNKNAAGSSGSVHIREIVFAKTKVARISVNGIKGLEIRPGTNVSIPVEVEFLRSLKKVKEVRFTVKFKEAGVSAVTGVLDLAPEYNTTTFKNPEAQEIRVSTSEQNDDGHALISCPEDTQISSFTSQYCTNVSGTMNCGTCTVGSQTCEVWHNNKACGDCHNNVVKHGLLTVKCAPSRRTCGEVCRAQKYDSWPGTESDRTAECSCRRVILPKECDS